MKNILEWNSFLLPLFLFNSLKFRENLANIFVCFPKAIFEKKERKNESMGELLFIFPSRKVEREWK